MMNTEVKFLEIRDRGTLIPAVAIRFIPNNSYDIRFMDRGGFSISYPDVFLMRYDEYCSCTYDPYKWNTPGRTMSEAHKYIRDNFDKIENESVIDIEYILGESDKEKVSQIW